MRSLSDFIAHAPREREDQPVKPLAAMVFVVVIIASASGVAFWIGSSISAQAAAPIDISATDFGY